MWGHQHSTRSYLQDYAESLFENISPKLDPRMFLLGILRKERDDRLPICVEPENCGVDVALFRDVDRTAELIWEKDERRNMWHSMPYLHDNYQYDVKRDSTCIAVQQLVDQNFSGKDVVSFVSESVDLEDYEVFVVLQFDKQAYDSFYSLRPSTHASRTIRGSFTSLRPSQPTRQSFLDSLIQTFLNETLETLYRPRAARAPQLITTDEKEVMRIAATDFVGSAIKTVRDPDLFPKNYTNLQEFFNIFDNISALNYEGDASAGKIVICNKNHPNFNIHLELDTPVGLHNYRKVRKLLETAARELSLWSDGHQILGLGRLQEDDYGESSQNLLSISFRGSHEWELIHGQQTILMVEYGDPGLPKPKVNKEKFNDLLQRTFTNATSEDLGKMWENVNTAINQKHGALLIISSEAESEADRLSNQSTKIKPVLLSESLVRNITSIDGATLLDITGTCYSIGVILDGMAIPKGTSNRGARYNSAIRYVECHYGKCVAVIISEDGMVNLYPDLRPRIQKSEITKHLEILRSISTVNLLDDDKYRIAMNWLSEHRFYLSSEQCDETNQLKRVCVEKPRTEPFTIRIIYDDLESNPEMNESYFLDE